MMNKSPKAAKQAKFLADMKAPPVPGVPMGDEAEGMMEDEMGDMEAGVPTPEEIDTMTATETAAPPMSDLSGISDAELEAELQRRKSGKGMTPIAPTPAKGKTGVMPPQEVIGQY